MAKGCARHQGKRVIRDGDCTAAGCVVLQLKHEVLTASVINQTILICRTGKHPGTLICRTVLFIQDNPDIYRFPDVFIDILFCDPDKNEVFFDIVIQLPAAKKVQPQLRYTQLCVSPVLYDIRNGLPACPAENQLRAVFIYLPGSSGGPAGIGSVLQQLQIPVPGDNGTKQRQRVREFRPFSEYRTACPELCGNPRFFLCGRFRLGGRGFHLGKRHPFCARIRQCGTCRSIIPQAGQLPVFPGFDPL